MNAITDRMNEYTAPPLICRRCGTVIPDGILVCSCYANGQIQAPVVKPLNVLVLCEFSGVVRDAFGALGHAAVSCDLLPSETPGHHIQGDCCDLGGWQTWDLVIAHPPCTYLANCGARWTKDNPERLEKRRESVEFVRWIMDLPVPRLAIENPIGHLSSAIGKPSQIIQPWQFGHGETKATCLWLKGLPKLTHTNIVDGREARIHKMPPSPDRGKLRSITYQGIADAMAEQWGGRVNAR